MRELVPIVRAIADQPVADDRCLRGTFGEAAQLAFSLDVASRLGYDLDRGRLDKTHHPFCTRFGAGDVRITTRVREDDLGDALFSTVHEAGHAMYEQGVSAALDGTPLGSGVSAGVHESQSRLWENVVGRSRAFWEHFFPALQRLYPEQFQGVPLDTFYRAINKVERSLIRTDADEVTYNLHVMLRFDLELDLLEGRLAVKDMPGRLARAHARPISASSRRTIATAACRTCTGTAAASAALPGLHHRQHSERAVLCRGGEGQSRHPVRDRGRRIRHAARLAHRQSLPARPQVHAERSDQARDRRADDHAAVSRLPAQQIRRALFVAGRGLITSS